MPTFLKERFFPFKMILIHFLLPNANANEKEREREIQFWPRLDDDDEKNLPEQKRVEQQQQQEFRNRIQVLISGPYFKGLAAIE